MIDWSQCPDVESVPERYSGAWVVKDSRVMVSGILDNFDADESPLAVARMFSLPVATVRRVLAFALTAQLRELLDARLAGRWTRNNAYRLDKLTRQLAEIDKASKRKPPR